MDGDLTFLPKHALFSRGHPMAMGVQARLANLSRLMAGAIFSGRMVGKSRRQRGKGISVPWTGHPREIMLAKLACRRSPA
jgi:hypothetical protein